MQPILEYQNYRRYIQDYYDWRKRTSAFSWREFAKIAGFASPIFLKMVCDDKANLGKKTVDQVADAMGLIDFDRLYFKELVTFNQAKRDDDKRKAFAEMKAIAKACNVKVLGEEGYAYYDSWINPVVRSLAPAMPGAMPKDLAAMCYKDVSAAEVKESLNFLVRNGFLTQTGKNSYEAVDKVIDGSADAIPLALRSMNRQMAQIAPEAIDRFAVDERNFSGITMGISKETYRKVVEKLEKFRAELVNMIAEEENVTERVYRLNMQFFPLTVDKEKYIQRSGVSNEDDM